MRRALFSLIGLIFLAPAGAQITISGTILDNNTDVIPSAQAVIIFEDDMGNLSEHDRQTVNSGDGSFSFSLTTPAGSEGYYLFTDNRAGFVDAVRTASSQSDCNALACYDYRFQTIKFDAFKITSDVTNADFLLTPGQAVFGNVSLDGGPFADVLVCATDLSTFEFCGRTDTSGDYFLPGSTFGGSVFVVTEQTPDPFAVRTFFNGSGPRVPYFDDRFAAAGTVRTVDISSANFLANFELERGGQISGTIQTSAGGPISATSTEYRVFRPDGSTILTTEDSGDTFLTPPLPIEPLFITAKDTDGNFVNEIWTGDTAGNDGLFCLGQACEALAPVVGANPPLTPGSTTNIVFELSATATIAGAVQDEFTTEIEGVDVCAFHSGGAIDGMETGLCGTSDMVGTYSITTVPVDQPLKYAALPVAPVSGTYQPEIYNGSGGISGIPLDFNSGIPVTPPNAAVTFSLPVGFSISGTLGFFNFDRGYRVEVFDTSSRLVFSKRFDSAAWQSYGLPSADYFVRFRNLAFENGNGARFVDEIYNSVENFICLDPFLCDPLAHGTAVSVMTSNVSSIDGGLEDGGKVTGRVTNEMGQPLAGVPVLIEDDMEMPLIQLTTDGNGRFVTWVPPSRIPGIRVFTNIPGFINEVYNTGGNIDCPAICGSTEITMGSILNPAVISPLENIDFQLALETFPVSGRVNTGGSAPTGIPTAEVCIYNGNGMIVDIGGIPTPNCVNTDGNGDWSMPEVPGGNFVFVASNGPNFEPRTHSGDPCDPCDLSSVPELVVTGPTSGVNFFLNQILFDISGQVSGSDASGPISGATVELFDTIGMMGIDSVVTDGSGLFAFSAPPGVYRINAAAAGFFPGSYNGGGAFTLDDDNLPLPEYDIQLDPQPQIGAISGMVTPDDMSLSPVGAFVKAIDTAGTTLAFAPVAADGSYLITDVPAGDVLVYFSGDGAGLRSTIYDGATGIACAATDCGDIAADLFTGGTLTELVVMAQAELADIDFTVTAGALLSTNGLLDEADRIGGSTTVCGNRMVIGAPGDDDVAEDAGAIFFYEKEGLGFEFVEKACPNMDCATPDPFYANGRFGESISCTASGMLVVGAPGEPGVVAKGNTVDKSAYIMALGGNAGISMLQQILQQNLNTGGGPLTGDTGFGASVSLNGSTMAIGAPTAGNSGMAAVMTFDHLLGQFVQSTMLSDPTATPGAGFGTALSVANGMVAVGSPNQVEPGLATGVANLFSALSGGSDWDNIGKFTNQGSSSSFGAALSLSGGLLAIGAPGAGVSGTEPGSAFVFDSAGGGLLATLQPGSSPGSGAAFGSSVSLANGTVAVGAPNANTSAGLAVLFSALAGWSEIQQISGNGGAFGQSLAFDGTSLVIGLPAQALQGVSAGQAIAFPIGDRLSIAGFEAE